MNVTAFTDFIPPNRTKKILLFSVALASHVPYISFNWTLKWVDIHIYQRSYTVLNGPQIRILVKSAWHILYSISRSWTGFLNGGCQRSQMASEVVFLLVVQVFPSICHKHVCEFITGKFQFFSDYLSRSVVRHDVSQLSTTWCVTITNPVVGRTITITSQYNWFMRIIFACDSAILTHIKLRCYIFYLLLRLFKYTIQCLYNYRNICVDKIRQLTTHP